MKYIFILIVFSLFLYTDNKFNLINSNLIMNSDKLSNREKIVKLEKHLYQLNTFLLKNNIWTIKYDNYKLYHSLLDKLELFKKETILLKKQKILLDDDKIILLRYQNDSAIIKEKLRLLKEYKNDPFQELLQPYIIKNIPKINNPFNIISGFSFKKNLKNIKNSLNNKFYFLNKIILSLIEKEKLIKYLITLYKESYNKQILANKLKSLKTKLRVYTRAFEIFKTSKSRLEQKIYKLDMNIEYQIDQEFKKILWIGITLISLFIIKFIIKYIIKKYIFINKNEYILNKTFNFFFILISILILIFSYLNNITYFITILSFISAGLAFALKDVFMSIIAWFNIMIGRSIKVGDRIKVNKNGIIYIGDIINISTLKIILHEDVTLTTINLNRRAGRIISIPNYYIFTDMIANYSHYGLKTVWDGIDISITFDSNLKKAQAIMKSITLKYSKGYADITKTKLNMLRSEYNLRNSSVEPRIFCSIGDYGVIISAWYLTNSYATLTLRSTISIEILDSIKKSNDIKIAIPSTFVKIKNQSNLNNLNSNIE